VAPSVAPSATDVRSSVAKAITALVLTGTGAVAAGLIAGEAALWVAVVTAALTGAGVYQIPNSEA
jgi:hypothetical protein